MVTNFDYLKNESKFATFADGAISEEKIILMDPVDRAGINEFEKIREKLCELMKYIPKNTIMCKKILLKVDRNYKRFIFDELIDEMITDV